MTHMIWPISYGSYDIGNVRDAIKSCKNLSRFSRRLFGDNIPVKMIVNVQIQDFLFTDKTKRPSNENRTSINGINKSKEPTKSFFMF